MPRWSSVLPLALLLAATPLAAEVHETRADGFIIRHSITVAKPPQAVWLVLVKPGDWWSNEHSWSGDAKNMTLTPQGGGCWCERIPPAEGSDFAGSVVHGMVVQATPSRILRLEGGLGPLQSEPARGLLTWALKEVPGGTTIQLEYNVGGSMRFKPAEIAPAVDKVLGEQIARLASALGGSIPAGDTGAQIDELRAD